MGMCRFANFFMWLFLADGCISVADELLRYNSGDQGLLGLRSVVALAVVVLAGGVYLGMLVDRRLPKLILLPQVLFAFWGMTGLWPLPFFILSDHLGVTVAALQVSLGLLPFFMLRGPGRSVLLRPSRFTGSGFSLGNLLLGLGGTVFLLPLLLMLFAGAGAVEAVHTSTAGFMTIDARGVTMQERVYRRGEKTVRLVGMIHIGDQAYYDELTRTLDGPRSLVLAEGVTDRKGLLKSNFSYERVAGILGLSTQEKMSLQGQLISVADLESASRDGANGPHILRADLDLADFDARTVEVLNVLGEQVFASQNLAEGLKSYNRWVNEHMDQERYEILVEDVVARRNRNLLEILEKSLRSYDLVVIPWGAMHMRGIEQGLLERGFKLRQTRERLSIDFDSLLRRLGQEG